MPVADGDPACLWHVDLADGIREGESEQRCGIVHDHRTLKVWKNDRLITFINGYVATADFQQWTYSYDDDGRLAREDELNYGDGGAGQYESSTAYTWSCP